MIVSIDEQKAMMEIMGFAKFNTTKVSITNITAGSLSLCVGVCGCINAFCLLLVECSGIKAKLR